MIDLSIWNITLPVDSKGTTAGEAVELPATGHLTPNADGSLTFHAPVDGAHTSGSQYPRHELREIKADGSLAAWSLATGATMTATLTVDAMPKLKDGAVGKAVIGQIHGKSNELIRLYWNAGVIEFHDDISGTDHKEHEFAFPALPAIPIGKQFSYEIGASTVALAVTIFLDGKPYSVSLTPDAKWTSDSLYFKAGVYLGENASQGATGFGQVTFHALDYSHTSGQGLGGLPTSLPPPSGAQNPAPQPVPTPPAPVPVPTPPIPAPPAPGPNDATKATLLGLAAQITDLLKTIK